MLVHIYKKDGEKVVQHQEAIEFIKTLEGRFFLTIGLRYRGAEEREMPKEECCEIYSRKNMVQGFIDLRTDGEIHASVLNFSDMY